jgi:hypothetical protein
MYIDRSLLMVLAVALVFFPSALEWISTGGTAWYRPYLLWALLVLLGYWIQRRRQRDDN